MPALIIDLWTLADFALGKLTPEASLEVIRELERNPQASRNLEFILTLMAFSELKFKETGPSRN
jgi:hypothetical protein